MSTATIAMPYQSAVPRTLLNAVAGIARTISAFGTDIRFLVVGKRQAESFCNVRFGIGIDEVKDVQMNPTFLFLGKISIAARVFSGRAIFLISAGVFGVSQKTPKGYKIYNIYKFLAKCEKAICGAGFRAFFEGAKVT